MRVVDIDYGCGIIEVGRQSLYEAPTALTYSELDRDRQRMLALISVEAFQGASFD